MQTFEFLSPTNGSGSLKSLLRAPKVRVSVPLELGRKTISWLTDNKTVFFKVCAGAGLKESGCLVPVKCVYVCSEGGNVGGAGLDYYFIIASSSRWLHFPRGLHTPPPHTHTHSHIHLFFYSQRAPAILLFILNLRAMTKLT